MTLNHFSSYYNAITLGIISDYIWTQLSKNNNWQIYYIKPLVINSDLRLGHDQFNKKKIKIGYNKLLGTSNKYLI